MSFKVFVSKSIIIQTEHGLNSFFSEEHEIRLWPTELPRVKTQFRNLCKVELIINKVFMIYSGR